MKFLLIFVLIESAKGIKIGCDFTTWSYTDILIQTSPTCIVVSMDFSDNSTHITASNGTSLQLSRIQTIDFGIHPNSNCNQFNLTFIPKGILSVFPNMTALTFDRCSIQTISADDFEEYPQLEIIFIRNTFILRVPGNLFEFTPNLRFIGLSSNSIQHVGGGLLNGLQNLQRVDFGYNTCINRIAWDSSEIPSLIEALRVNCPDIETTTKITTTTIPSTNPPRCEIENFEEFVCGLDEEVENLIYQVDNLSDENRNLKIQLEEQAAKLREESARLDEIEKAVLDLTSRPCAC